MASFKFPKTNPESLRAMAYAIRNEMSGGTSVDDSRFSLRQIETTVRHVACQIQKAEDLADELLGIMPSPSRNRLFSCLPLIDSADFSCKCGDSESQFKKAMIPKMCMWKGQPFIGYAGGVSMKLPFMPVQSIFELSALQGEVKKPMYFVVDNGLYVWLPKAFVLMCEISVIGIPEDPTATSTGCFDVWSGDWPVSQHIKAITKERVMQGLGLNMVSSSHGRDIRNNANHDNQFVTKT